MKEQDHVMYLIQVRKKRRRIDRHRILSRLTIIEIIQKFQDNLENNYKENKKRAYEKRKRRLKNSKWVMGIPLVKKFRKLYFAETFIAWSFSSYMILFHYNFMVKNIIGSWIVVGCGFFGLAHIILTFMMDYAVYKRDKKENSWFF